MCSCVFRTGDLLPLQEEQRKKTKKNYIQVFNSLLQYEKVQNMWILFKKLYRTYLDGTTQTCFVQFLKQDLHIFAYKYSVYICNETE